MSENMGLELAVSDFNKLTRLEEELWIEETRFDRTYMEIIMTPDFIEFGRSGRTYTRDQVLSQERGPIDAVIPLQNFKIRFLTEDVAQVTYDSEATFEGITEKGRRSSIWTKSEGGWELRFHQGTPFGD